MTSGFLVSAPRSGSGKTVITLGLMRALTHRGHRVVGAKNGPDYIDPAFHAAATGIPSLNLDTWAMSPALLHALTAEATARADLLIVEGSMGLFDGVVAPPRRSGASADLAAQLNLPIILVLDVSGQAQTAAALVHGCATFDPDIRIGGVILNRVASPRHKALVTDALESRGFRVIGALPRNDILVLPERHLGLVQAAEISDLISTLDAIGTFIGEHVDLDTLSRIAAPIPSHSPDERVLPTIPVIPPGQKIAIARDTAFSFLYPHVLHGWQAAGAQLVFFSPLADEIPALDADACWLPGGYPELHAGRLAGAERFKKGLRRFAETRPVHGECGGYMVLGQTLIDKDGVSHAMVALLGANFSFAKRKMQLGYRMGTVTGDCAIGRSGTKLRGHEFHYATIIDASVPDAPFALIRDLQNGPATPAGGRRGLVTGSFFHVIATEA